MIIDAWLLKIFKLGRVHAVVSVSKLQQSSDITQFHQDKNYENYCRDH